MCIYLAAYDMDKLNCWLFLTYVLNIYVAFLALSAQSLEEKKDIVSKCYNMTW